MEQMLLLSGRAAIGKTTIVKKIVDKLGDRAGGFYTEEIFGPGGRKGFQAITLDGHKTTLAHVDIRSRSRVGRYGVDVAAFERVGVTALRKAIAQSEIVIIDEVGKMELFSSRFKAEVLRAVECGKPVVATVMSSAHPWVDALKVMPGIKEFEVTYKNRDEMPIRILNMLGIE